MPIMEINPIMNDYFYISEISEVKNDFQTYNKIYTTKSLVHFNIFLSLLHLNTSINYGSNKH